MTMTLLQLQVLNWWFFLTSFQPTSLHCYFTFLLINDVRMTTFTHQLLSRKTSTPEVWQCKCEYSSRSATVSVAVLHMGYAEVVFIQPGGKHHVTWCLTKTSHPTSRWDVAVINGHCSRTVLPLTPPETQKLASVRTFSSLSQTFCPPNSPDLNTVNLPSGVLFTGFIGSLRSPWKSLNFGKKSRPLKVLEKSLNLNFPYFEIFAY